ncbi:MerR family transcriptional regulator [Brevibacterium atlanticum]|uniref:MerR family transcriptional regulator n=1 Tax=Brevibacterium atlanticum TaxID=2697563 RepID=UPI001423C917|nr:MerR family transcriptional regulator [Brevibacterium atlanticum]
MRIAELAELAGVTVRTIRYYHQVGALPEPPRRSNGYRDYTADHLVALLRISQLTSSGLSLAQAGAVAADSGSSSTEEALDEVDRVLEEKIAALTEQRERLARARAGRHVGLSRAAAALSLTSADIPVAIAIAHLYRDHPQIDVFADALLDPQMRSALARLQERFDAIDETTTDCELCQLMAQAQRLVSEVADGLPALTEEQLQVILDLAERDLNDRQKDFMRIETGPPS